MKNLIVYIAILIAFTSCSTSEVKEVKTSESVAVSAPIEPKTDRKVNNPVFFMETGTSFGLYMQELYKLGKFDDMVNFTSSKTISKF